MARVRRRRVEPVHVRELTTADLSTLRGKLLRRGVAPTAQRAQMWRELATGERGVGAVAVSGSDGLVGVAAVDVFPGQTSGMLHNLFVDPRYRGRGLAEELCRVSEELTRQRGCERITALVREDNASSRRVFEKRGYRWDTENAPAAHRRYRRQLTVRAASPSEIVAQPA